MGTITFKGHGANVVGSLGSSSLVQDMPTALSLDGVSDFASGSSATGWTQNGADLANTVTFWVKTEATSGYIFQLSVGTGNADGLALLVHDGNIESYLGQTGGGGGGIETTQTINNNEWQHITYTVSGTGAGTQDQTIYINSVSNITAGSSRTRTDDPSLLPAIGARVMDPTNNFAAAEVRDVRVFTSVLSQTEIDEVFADVNMGGGTATATLEGWWKCEDGSTPLADSSTNSNTLVLDGGTWDKSEYNLNQIGSGSVSGTATISGGTWNLLDSTYLDSDADAGDYVNLGKASDIMGSTASGNVSMSVWCKPQSTSKGYVLSMHRDSLDSSWVSISLNTSATDGPGNQLAASLATVYRTTGSTHAWVGAEDVLTVDEWAHIVVVCNTGSGAELYVNGNSVATQSDIFTEGPSTATGSTNFGAMNATQHLADAAGRDVRVYNTALTASQVELLYKGQWDGAPVGWWKFNEGTGAAVTDSGVNEEPDGTIYNATWVNPTYATEDHVIIGTYPNTVNPTLLPTLSAPRGTWNFCHNVSANEATLRNYGNFIHNSGAFSPGNETHSNNGGSRFTTKFYDVIRDQSGQFSFQGCIAWDSGVNLAEDITLTQTEWKVDDTSIFTAGDYIVMTEESATAEVIRIASIPSVTGLTVERGQWGLAPSTYSDTNSIYYKPSNNVEGSLISTAGETRLWGSANDQPTGLVFGTPTTSGTVSSSTVYGLQLGCVNSCAGIVGVSSLYPVNLVGTSPQIDWQSSVVAGGGNSASYIFYGNTTTAENFDKTTTASDTNFKMVGDTKWADFEFGESGDYFLYNNQRLECDNCEVHGASNVYWGTAGTTLLMTGDYTVPNNSSEGNNGESIIITGTSSTTTITLQDGSFNTTNVMMNTTGTINCADTKYGYSSIPDNIIVGAGTYALTDTGAETAGMTQDNLRVAADATFEPGIKTNIINGGDFNVAGGFIGKGAYSGDGVNDNFMQINPATDMEFGTGALTIEAWVKGTATGGLIGSYWGSDLPMYQLDVGDGTATNMRILATGAGGASTDGLTQVDAKATTNVIDGKWHHVVGVRDTSAGLVKLYIDGKLENESSDAATVAEGGNTNNGQRKMVGARGYYGELDGDIARASYWKVALTEAEIRSMMFQDWSTMAAADVIDDSKCVGWYEFSDTQSATDVTDMTGSGNTGALTSTDLWAGEGDVTVPSANPSSKIVFDNDGGTCNYIFGVDAPGYTHGLDFRTLEVASGTSLVVEDVGTYGAPYFWCSDRHLRLMSGSTISGSGVIDLIRYRQEGGAASGSIYAEKDTGWGNFGFYMDGTNPLVDMPASSSTVETFTLNEYINISDSTTMHLTKDTTINNTNGIYTGRGANTTLTEGRTLICNRVRPHGGDQVGNTFNMAAGSTIQFTGSAGFADSDDNVNSLYRLNANGEAAGIFATDVAGDEEAFIQVDESAPLDVPTSAITMAAWVKPLGTALSAGTSYMCVCGKHNSYRMYINGHGPPSNLGELSVQLEDVGNVSSTVAISGDVWMHIATTWDGSDMKIYFDGIEVTSSAQTGTIADYDKDFWIGKMLASGDQFFPGSIADVRLYSTGLTSGNCLTLASINPATNVSGTYADPDNDFGALGWWKCGATASGTLDATNYGESGSTIDGSVSGSAKSGFCNIYRSNAGTWALTPNRVKTGLNADSVWTFQNTYTGGDMADAYVASGQTIVTKGTVVM